MRYAFFVMMVAMLSTGCGAGAVGAAQPIVPTPEPEVAAPEPSDADFGHDCGSESCIEDFEGDLDAIGLALVIEAGHINETAFQSGVAWDDRWGPAMRRMRAAIRTWRYDVDRSNQASGFYERGQALLSLQDDTEDLEYCLRRLEELADTADVDDLTDEYGAFLDSLDWFRRIIAGARSAVLQAGSGLDPATDVH